MPTPPPHYLPRPTELQRLRASVMSDLVAPVVVAPQGRVTVLQGMGGAGKSVLAAAFAASSEVRRAFPEGIVWVSAGRQHDPGVGMRLVAHALGDTDWKSYGDPASALARLGGLLAEARCLLVIDDVWRLGYAEPYVNTAAQHCRVVLTTRDGAIAGALGAAELAVVRLTEAEAYGLLAAWCGAPPHFLPPEAAQVVGECENLPLALALCGAMARDGLDFPASGHSRRIVTFGPWTAAAVHGTNHGAMSRRDATAANRSVAS